MMNSYSKNVFVYSSIMYPTKDSVIKYLSNIVDKKAIIWIIDNEKQSRLKQIIKESGYSIHSVPSLYKRLGPSGEDAIYHFCLSNTIASIFFISQEDIVPRPMMIATEYQNKNDIKFKII